MNKFNTISGISERLFLRKQAQWPGHFPGRMSCTVFSGAWQTQKPEKPYGIKVSGILYLKLPIGHHNLKQGDSAHNTGPAYGAAIGTMMQRTCGHPTATTLQTRTPIGTTTTGSVVCGGFRRLACVGGSNQN
jgi:hypothetical protein